MKLASLVLLGSIFVALMTTPATQHQPASSTFLVPQAAAATVQGDAAACTPPTQMAATPEQTAWQLFIAATCPVNATRYPYVVWETWIEQSQLYSPTAKAGEAAGNEHRLHGSPLAEARRSHGPVSATAAGVGAPQGANQNCNTHTVSGRTICEEVRINPDARKYILTTAGGLQIRANQSKLAASGGIINFTTPSVEIKADWIQYPLATCSNPPQGVHVEVIGNNCYALAGLHLISKLTPNWVWATFEPQNLTTNPKRCVELGCSDPWGSSPAFTAGGPSGNTQQTAQIKSLMQAAKLAPEWYNYRLDGVQMLFNNVGNQQIANATLLGNSIIEGDNVGMPMLQASCITCHSVSSVASNGADGINFLAAAEFSPVGSNQQPPAPTASCKWIQRDFVWSLFLAYPKGPSPCLSSPAEVRKVK